MRFVSLAIIALSAASGCSVATLMGPVKVGVLLPITGPNANDFDLALEMARKRINMAGGIRGRHLELVYRDLGPPNDSVEQTVAFAKEFVGDSSIQAVIGTDYDDTTEAIAKMFIDAQKLLVSPAATTAELIRQYGGGKFLWRTLESDVAQAQVMVAYAKSHHAKSMAVLATSDLYGKTFFDGIPRAAANIGMAITDTLRVYQGGDDCAKAMQMLRDNGIAKQRDEDKASADAAVRERGETSPDTAYFPDWLVLIPNSEAQQICMIREARKAFAQRTPQLFFSDGGQHANVWQKLKELNIPTDGILGTSIEASLTSHFDEVFSRETGIAIPSARGSYTAQTFDALLMVAYAMQRANLQPYDKLGQAFWDIATLDSKNADVQTEWQNIPDALQALAAGKSVYVRGATGNLQWDHKRGVDLLESTYAVWEMRGSQQIYRKDPEHYLVRGKQSKGVSAALTAASIAYRQTLSETGRFYSPKGPRGNLWALIAATSSTFANYRHQADALRFYRTLRNNGVSDDHILFVAADDIANNPKNPVPGTVYNAPDGPNLYHPRDQQIDYLLADILKRDRLGEGGADHLLRMLSGDASDSVPKVLTPRPDDNVVVFLVGHGGDSGLLVGGDTAESAEQSHGSFVTPPRLAEAVEKLHRKGYRQIWLAVEACHSGVLGRNLKAPGALLLTGSNANEDSFSNGYDPATQIWLSDEFASAVNAQLETAMNTSFFDGYDMLYQSVPMSHVSAFNSLNFGDTRSVPFADFVIP